MHTCEIGISCVSKLTQDARSRCVESRMPPEHLLRLLEPAEHRGAAILSAPFVR
jgi:hypothetical protein